MAAGDLHLHREAQEERERVLPAVSPIIEVGAVSPELDAMGEDAEQTELDLGTEAIPGVHGGRRWRPGRRRRERSLGLAIRN